MSMLNRLPRCMIVAVGLGALLVGARTSVANAEAGHMVKVPSTKQGPVILIQGLENRIVWKYGDGPVNMPLHFYDFVRPTDLSIQPDYGDGNDGPSNHETLFLATFPKSAMEFKVVGDWFHTWSDQFESYHLKPGWTAEAGEYKLEKGQDPLIVLAFSDSPTNVRVVFFRYHAPANMDDAGRIENWEQVGEFVGYGPVRLHADRLDVPSKTAGTSTQYHYANGHFYEVDDPAKRIQ